MKIIFYGTQYFSHQVWADNYEESQDKDNLKIYEGIVEESYNSTNGDLIHFVNYEKGTILVQDKDKLN